MKIASSPYDCCARSYLFNSDSVPTPTNRSLGLHGPLVQRQHFGQIVLHVCNAVASACSAATLPYIMRDIRTEVTMQKVKSHTAAIGVGSMKFAVLVTI